MESDRNEQLELELYPEEATELPGLEQSVLSTEKKPKERTSGCESTLYERLCTKTLDYITEEGVMMAAFGKVARNGGSGGIDGMKAEELMPYFYENYAVLSKSLLEGTYKPEPVKRVEIPKENGKKRKLGIPTLVDRGVQMAVAMVLERIYEPYFSDTSYGFRPGRSAQDALKKCLEYANEGYVWVVDMDLERYFDTVPQSKLLEIISRRVKDGRVISLIYKFLKAGVMENGILMPTELGVPQGGCLSPILANIMLNECDKELEKRGLKFVRYADDMVIFTKSRRSAERVLESITRFIEGKLKLRVNREKTVVRKITDNVKFLGHSFWTPGNGEIRLCVHEKSYSKLKDKLRLITRRKSQLSWEELKQRLRWTIIGWVSYFRHAEGKSKMEQLDGWLRHRIRCLIFRRYWRVRSRYAFFTKNCKAPHEDALKVANARQGFWAFSGFHQVSKWVNNNLLRRAGYTFLYDVYQRVHTAI